MPVEQATEPRPRTGSRRWRWLRRALLWLVLGPVALGVLLVLLIYLPPVQGFIRARAVGFLQEKTGSAVQLEDFSLRFPLTVRLEGLFVPQEDGDTLLYARRVDSSMGLGDLFRGRVRLTSTELHGLRAHITQNTDSVFNFDHIVRAFAGNDTTTEEATADTSAGSSFSMDGLLLTDARVELDLAPSGLKMRSVIGALDVEMNDMDAPRILFHVASLDLTDAAVTMSTTPGEPAPDAYPDLPNPFEGLDITLGELRLKNVRYSLTDATTRDSMDVSIGNGQLNVDELDLSRQRAAIASLSLVDVRFIQLTRDTSVTLDMQNDPPWLDQHDGFRYWMRGMDISVADLHLTRSAIGIHQGVITDPVALNDPEHLVLSAMDLQAKNLVLNDQRADLVLGRFKATAAGDTKLQAALSLTVTPAQVELKNVRIAVDSLRTELNAMAAIGDLTTLYRDANNIPFRTELTSNVDLRTLRDIAARVGVQLPAQVRADERWATHATVAGSLNALDTILLAVKGDRGTTIDFTGHATNVLHWPATRFDADLKNVEMGDGLRRIVHAFAPSGTTLPARFHGYVHAKGSGSSMQAVFDLHSDLGDARGEASAAGIGKELPDALHADMEVNRLLIQRFTGDTAIGPVSLHVTADGEHLNSADRKGELTVQPTEFAYLGQDLSRAYIAARLDADSIHLGVGTGAEAMDIDLAAHLRWPARSDTVSGAVDLRVAAVDLFALGLYQYPLVVSGDWLGTGSYSTDGATAFAIAGDSVQIANDERTFLFEEFEAEGQLRKDTTVLVLNSDAVALEYHTNAAIDSLVPWTKRRLLTFFSKDTLTAPQLAEFATLKLDLPRTEWLTDIVLPPLRTIDLETFDGSWTPTEMHVNVDLPLMEYDSIRVAGLALRADAEGRKLDGALTLDSVQYTSYRIKGLSLSASSAPGALLTDLRIQEADQPVKYNIPMRFERSDDVVTAHIDEGLILDTAQWQAAPGNLLRFTDQGVEAQDFVLSSGPQSVELITARQLTSVKLKDFEIGSLLNIVTLSDTVPLLDGVLTGEVVLPLSPSVPLAAHLMIADVVALGQPLGDAEINAKGTGPDAYEGTLSLKNGSNNVDAEALYDGSGEEPRIAVKSNLDFGDIAFVKPFASAVLFDLGGGLHGDLDWSTTNGAHALRGDLKFTEAMVGVNQTGARYTLKNEHITADEHGIHFDRFTARDSLGREFVLDGDVFTTDLRTMRFDLSLRADSFQLINAKASKTAAFYGDLFTSTDVRITGTDRAPVVKGELGILDGTTFSVVLPGSQVELITSDGIVEFTTDLAGLDTLNEQTDAERLRDSLRAQLPKLDMDLHLLVDSGAVFNVVLDPTTGDAAYFQGDADLRFQYSPEGRMYLSGPFTATRGGYTLEFYGLVKKRFELVPGSRVVWDGDPVDARLDIQAKYISESAAYPLVANSSGALSEAERNRLATRLPFEVRIDVSGAMAKPDITFGIELPRTYRNSYPKVNDELDRLADRSREEERNRQVFGLLVLNSFIQDEGAGGAPSSGIASSAARSSVNGILTDQLNKITGRYVKGIDIELGVNTVDQSAGNAVYQRTSVDYKVSKSILDERLSFEVGGSVGVDERRNNASNVSSTRAAQYAILYDLTRDGRFRLRGFYENAFDLYDGEITDSGIALMYTRDFEENEKAREAAREQVRRQLNEERKRQRAQQGERDDANEQRTEP